MFFCSEKFNPIPRNDVEFVESLIWQTLKPVLVCYWRCLSNSLTDRQDYNDLETSRSYL